MRSVAGVLLGFLSATMVAAGLTGCQVGGAHPAAATQPATPASADASFFYDELAPYGTWADIADYGPCWYPTGVAPGWRPYTVGRWVYADDYGWLWAHGEKWGWATDHYGRWTFLPSHGWVWVPGHEWAPAWVAWRSGGGYVGWAPLPPTKPHDTTAAAAPDDTAATAAAPPSRDVPINADDLKSIPPGAYTFVASKFLTDEKLADHLEPVTRNVTLRARTSDVTQYVRAEDDHVAERGLSVDQISEATTKPVKHVHVTDAPLAGAAKVSGDAVAVYSPRVTPDTSRRMPPLSRQPSAVMMSEERQRLDAYHLQLRADMEKRQQEELDHPPAGDSLEQVASRQDRERQAWDQERQREVEAVRRRQREERLRATEEPHEEAVEAAGALPAAQKPKYEIPPEWQLPPEMMDPPARGNGAGHR